MDDRNIKELHKILNKSNPNLKELTKILNEDEDLRVKKIFHVSNDEEISNSNKPQYQTNADQLFITKPVIHKPIIYKNLNLQPSTVVHPPITI